MKREGKPTRMGAKSRGGNDDLMGMKKRPKSIEGWQEVDYRDYELLRKFITERGKILPSRITGATAQQQRQIKGAIRRARVMGLLP